MELFCVEEIRKEKIRKDFRRGTKARSATERPARWPLAPQTTRTSQKP